MKPRSIWTGHIKISLLTIPIRVYTALNEADRISFNQLHKDCHQRLKQQLVCPVHGKVERDQVVKGYEVEKDRFVVMDVSDLEAVKLETTHTIELVQFIRPKELDSIFLETPYFIGPDGPVSQEAYAVLREALRKTNYLALGQVVLSGKEKIVAIKPVNKGLLMTTMRYPAEIRQAASYFDDVAAAKVDDAQIALARQLIENKAATFNPAAFTDRYQAALLDSIKAKVNGAQPIQVKPAAVGQVIDLLDALKQSVADTAKRRNGSPVRMTRTRTIKVAA
jgi:DNA end-binding protein Ku